MEPLGKGNYGNVYKAHLESIELDLALKIIPYCSFVRDTDMHTLILGEAKTLQNSSHPHLMTVFQQIEVK